jgi:hypothetical protein
MIKGKVYTIKRGESIMSLDSWASRWGWDKSKVRRFMTLLKDHDMIVLNSDSITTHLSVCNYETYQDERHTDETQTKRTRNADDTHTTPIEEGKKDKKERKKENTIIPSREEFISYGLGIVKDDGYEFALSAKYETWVENDWRDGYNKKIVNWKTKIQNTIPHLTPMKSKPAEKKYKVETEWAFGIIKDAFETIEEAQAKVEWYNNRKDASFKAKIV